MNIMILEKCLILHTILDVILLELQLTIHLEKLSFIKSSAIESIRINMDRIDRNYTVQYMIVDTSV